MGLLWSWFPSWSDANTQSPASPLRHPWCSSVPLMYSDYLTMLPHGTELGLPLLIFSGVPRAQASGFPQHLPTLPPILVFKSSHG